MAGRAPELTLPFEQRFWLRVNWVPANACWEWQGSRYRTGYGNVRDSRANGRHTGAHRIAYELAVGPIPPAREVLHICDNRLCCNPEHLRLGTHADNQADMKMKGRTRSGVRQLTIAQAREIRQRVAAGEVQRSLAREFGVSHGVIWNIVHRQDYYARPWPGHDPG